MFDRNKFESERIKNALDQSKNKALQELALKFVIESDKYNYGYQWTWLGLPIIQLTTDVVATQEIIWANKPDVIIETGVAWGGSIIFYATILQILGNGKVIGIETALPEKNIKKILSYPFSDRINLIEGSSIDAEVVSQTADLIDRNDKVMLILDSNHTHEHVLEELKAYTPFVTKGQFLIVSDTVVEDIPVQKHRPRPWGPGNNPKTALDDFLKTDTRFEVDEYLNKKLLTTFTPNGYLRCIK